MKNVFNFKLISKKFVCVSWARWRERERRLTIFNFFIELRTVCVHNNKEWEREKLLKKKVENFFIIIDPDRERWPTNPQLETYT